MRTGEEPGKIVIELASKSRGLDPESNTRNTCANISKPADTEDVPTLAFAFLPLAWLTNRPGLRAAQVTTNRRESKERVAGGGGKEEERGGS